MGAASINPTINTDPKLPASLGDKSSPSSFDIIKGKTDTTIPRSKYINPNILVKYIRIHTLLNL